MNALTLVAIVALVLGFAAGVGITVTVGLWLDVWRVWSSRR